MARTKKAGQTLGGKLPSTRAKHDTALEEEILGKIAAKSAENKKPPKFKKPKAKGDLVSVPAKIGKKPSRKSVQDAKKEKRREYKKELIEMLSSNLEIESNKANELIKKTNTQFTMGQMSRAASALHELKEEKFTQAEFITKVAEYHEGDKQVQEQAIQSKAARKAEAIQSGGKKAKERAEKKAKLTSKPLSNRNPDLQQSQLTVEPVKGRIPVQHQSQWTSEAHPAEGVMPGNDGFSVEFWMDLAGSREAAASAAS